MTRDRKLTGGREIGNLNSPIRNLLDFLHLVSALGYISTRAHPQFLARALVFLPDRSGSIRILDWQRAKGDTLSGVRGVWCALKVFSALSPRKAAFAFILHNTI